MLRRFAFLCALPLVAQTPALRGPISGHVVHEGALRPIVGVPGAAYLGDALVTNVRAASTSPDGKHAVVNSGGKLIRIDGLDETPSAVEVAADLPGASLFAWSAKSDAVAIYDASRGLAILRDHAVEPVSALEGRVAAIILAQDGTIAAAVEDAGIFLAKAGTAPRLISRASRPAAMASDGVDLFYADADQGELLRIANFIEGSGAVTFAAGAGDISGLAVSRGVLLAASKTDRRLSAFRIATGEPVRAVELEFEPASLHRAGEGLWLLNAGKSPIQAADQELNAWFIPAER